jgi:hypothetical protein
MSDRSSHSVADKPRPTRPAPPRPRSLVRVAGRPSDYRRWALNPNAVEKWEDGARTDGRAGTYEWWYFDAHLADGAKVVIVFMTKDLATPQKPLEPTIRISLDLPTGRSFEKVVTFDAGSYSSSSQQADIRISRHRFAGDLTDYRITVAIDELAFDLRLHGDIPPWRPQTGYILYGADGRREFSWLPAVPQGTVTGTYTVGGDTRPADGVGYHDHNWGNVAIMDIIHDWYWARGQAGPYSTIASYITSHRHYGYAPLPVFMLAKDGVVIADDASRVTFEALGDYVDATTGKPVSNVTRYTYTSEDDRFVVTFTRHRDLAVARFVDEIQGIKRLAARLVRFDGAYLRFTGEIRVQRFRGDTLIEQFSNDALWELMYLGHARHQGTVSKQSTVST